MFTATQGQRQLNAHWLAGVHRTFRSVWGTLHRSTGQHMSIQRTSMIVLLFQKVFSVISPCICKSLTCVLTCSSWLSVGVSSPWWWVTQKLSCVCKYDCESHREEYNVAADPAFRAHKERNAAEKMYYRLF